MFATRRNPFPSLCLAYDPAVDAVVPSYTGDEKEERLQAELLECRARLIVSSDPEAKAIASRIVNLTHRLEIAEELRRVNEEHRVDIDGAMETDAYKQACDLVRENVKCVAGGVFNGQEIAELSRKIMQEVVSGDNKARIGVRCDWDTLSSPGSFSPNAGDLVGCSCYAFNQRNFREPFYVSVVVIAAAGDDEDYLIARSSDGAKGYELEVVGRNLIAAWGL